MERRITVIDMEPRRLRATVNALATAFPGDPVEPLEWHSYGNDPLASAFAARLLHASRKAVEQFVTTNIDGVDTGLVSALLADRASRIHCVLTSCYDFADVAYELRRRNLTLGDRLGYVHCPNGLQQKGSHRERLHAYVAALPPGHPFHVASTSTTYSTRESETYAASRR